MATHLNIPNALATLKAAQGTVFPSYSLAIYHGGERILHQGGSGLHTLFDLASLTKVLATTTLVALSNKKSLLNAGDPVQKFVPEFPTEKVLLSHLLNHSSGLPAWLPLHEEFHTPVGRGTFDALITPPLARIRYLERICQSWQTQEFERQCVYSDLGFLLLGWILEKAAGMPFDALFQDWIAGPLRLRSLQFLPLSPNIAPTEDCPWRGHVLRGEVHDDNCYVLGGIAGHAGLFGTASEVLELALHWLNPGAGHAALLDAETVNRYWHSTHVPGSTRVWGWDSPSENSSSGHFFSAESRGHLGFTGTSLWIDPCRDLIVALLTNRVHPSRNGPASDGIRVFRPQFHDALMKDLRYDLK